MGDKYKNLNTSIHQQQSHKMLFKNQDFIHLQSSRKANYEVLETGVLRFENKQSSADMDDRGGVQREALLSSPGLSWGE